MITTPPVERTVYLRKVSGTLDAVHYRGVYGTSPTEAIVVSLYQKTPCHAGAGGPLLTLCTVHVLMPRKTGGIMYWQRQEGICFLAFVFAG